MVQLETFPVLEEAATPLSVLLKCLGSSESGLSASAADEILRRVGANQIEDVARKRVLQALIVRFGNPLVLVLLGAAVISALTGDVASFAIITIIIAMSVLLDVVQEHRAQDAAEGLRQQASLTTKAIRDGEPVELPAARIVPGDVILLSAGDLVPADCRLIESRDLYANEALLTGEPIPLRRRWLRCRTRHQTRALFQEISSSWAVRS
jgi:Mg2+-importing ATPase